jgi:hypothetical protein
VSGFSDDDNGWIWGGANCGLCRAKWFSLAINKTSMVLTTHDYGSSDCGGNTGRGVLAIGKSVLDL